VCVELCVWEQNEYDQREQHWESLGGCERLGHYGVQWVGGKRDVGALYT